MTFLGWLSDLLERLSDLQLGDEKVTLNDLEGGFLRGGFFWGRLVNLKPFPGRSEFSD